MNKTIHIDSMKNEKIEQALNLRNESKWLPKYHISPPFGLLNDPNGLMFQNGKYTIFYQWYPGGATHGLKHWMQLESENLIDFKNIRVGIKPESPIDAGGSFSGSHFNYLGNNYIIYTSNNIENEHVVQRQILSEYKQGKIINKRLLIDNESYVLDQFRDPTVFDYKENKMILVGAKKFDGSPCIAMYKLTKNLKAQHICNLEVKIAGKSNMIECPQIIKMDDKYIFISSPQGIDMEGTKYQNTFNVVYSTFDEFDLNSGKLINETSDRELDFGHDFYAPQIFKDNHSLVLIAWAGCGKSKYPEKNDGWMNLLSMPRELKFENNKLLQFPHESIKNLIGDYQLVSTSKFDINNKQFTIKINIKDQEEIKIGNDNKYMKITRIDNQLIFDRSKCDEMIESLHGDKRVCRLSADELEIFVDNSIIEIFFNNNENTLTSRFYIEDLSFIKTAANYYFAKMDSIKLVYRKDDFE